MKENKIIITEDGSNSIRSTEYGVTYHSKFGAIQESYHVFINAALRFKAVLQQEFSILEIGFGTGLNAYISLLEARKRNLKIRYTGIEAYPISVETAAKLNYSSLLYEDDPDDLFLKIHSSAWDSIVDFGEYFSLEKQLKKFEEIDFREQFDIIYFDAFAPDAQPELWTEDIFVKMYTALKPDGILVTYCAKGVVKRRMKKVGFKIEALEGPTGKREMTRAVKPA